MTELHLEEGDLIAPEMSPPLLRSELETFGERHGMTIREFDVFYLLVCGHSSVATIADRLGLSRNTVHNHFKNVFRRTRTNSKAAVLSLLIREVLGRRSDVEPFIRRPRVLVVDHDGYTGQLLFEALQRRGLRVFFEHGAERLLERIGELRVDAVVIDASLLSGPSKLLTAVRGRYGTSPTLLVTNDTHGPSTTSLMKQGAGAVFERPISPDQLAFTILEHVTDSPYERSRLLRIDTDLRARINRGCDGRVCNIGFGGAFVAISSDSVRAFDRGAQLELEVQLDDQRPLTLQGEVVWSCARDRPASPSGVGLRFLDLRKHERARVEELVRRKKLADLAQAQAPRRPI